MFRQAFRMESKRSSVPGLAEKLRALCSSMGISGGDVMVVELCAIEAVGSAIEHGYGGASGHTVEVVVTLDETDLTLEVRDRGRALPPEHLVDGDTASPPSWGAGLAIPPSAMELVCYASARGVNTLTLSKKVLVGPRPACAATEGDAEAP